MSSASLGSRLRDCRLRAGLTQQEAADLAGVSVAGLRDVEQGRVLRPRASTLRRLADAMGLSSIELDQLVNASEGDTTTRSVRVEILGPLRVTVAGAVVDPGSETQRVLLGLLALSPNGVVSRDALVEGVWGARPPLGAVELLQSRISRLRRRLQPPGSDPDASAVMAARGGYQLTIARDAHDMLIFQRLVACARQARDAGDQPHAVAVFAQAVRLWRGEPLTGLSVLTSHPVVVNLIADWQQVVCEYAQVACELGRFDEVLPHLERITKSDPLHELAHAQLMIALAGSGQQAAALSIFDELRRRLAGELGTDPSPELASAHQKILRQEVTRPGAAPVSAHRQLPPDIADFSGRDDEIKALHDQLPVSADGSTAVVVSSIEGMAGVGKTRLAVHVAHQLLAAGRYADQQLYVDLHGHAHEPPADPAAVLASFLYLLGVPNNHIPQATEERAALYRDRLYGKNALVILDNAVSEEQVQPLLPASPTNLVLITSRRVLALDGASTLQLNLFTTTEATELLTQVLGRDRVETDLQATHRVIELCGHLPLAVALMARRLQARPAWTFADLATRLAETGDRLGEIAAGTRRLRAVFDLSYYALGTDEQRTFRLLGLHPGEDFTAESVAALTARTPLEARHQLDRLVDEHLVTLGTGHRYSLHDLLRDYARRSAQTEDSAGDRQAAISRMLDYYLHSADLATRLLQPHRWVPTLAGTAPRFCLELESRDGARQWLHAERACLTAAVTHAAQHDHPSHAWQLAFLIRGYLYLHGYLQDWEHTHEIALSAAVADNDEVGEAVMSTYLGGAYMQKQRGHDALAHLYRALELHRRAGNDALEATTLGSLGVLCFRLGRFPEALGHTERAASLCAGKDAHREGVMRTNMGFLLALLGRRDEATENYHRGLALSLESAERRNKSGVLSNIGDSHRLLGQWEEAVKHYKRALDMSTEHGFRPTEGYVRHRLGITLRELGHIDEALDHLQEAWRIIRLFGVVVTESEVLVDLGAVFHDAGNLEAALDSLEHGLQRSTENHERYQQARAHKELTRYYQSTGQHELAAEHQRLARVLLGELEIPNDGTA